MAMPGRNDPCPCGSGKKFKKCCIDTYQEERPERQTAPEANRLTRDKLPAWIDRELKWESELYRLQAQHYVEHADAAFDPEDLRALVRFWHDFAHATRPIFQKYGAFSAALEYFTPGDEGRGVTQTRLAAKYGVSSGTVSKRYAELADYAEALDAPSETGGASQPNMERMYRDIDLLLKERQIESIEEAEAFVRDYMDRAMAGKPVPTPQGVSARERAQDLLFDAADATTSAERVRLAREAIALYPDSPDAYVILGEESSDLEQARAYFRQGVEAGERDLGAAFFAENEGHFWGLSETRPYMRAKYNYAEFSWYADDVAEAERHLEEMLRLNFGDNMGARYLLAAAYLRLGKLDEAEALFARFEDEASAFFAYDRLALEFIKNGASSRLKLLYQAATQANKHALTYLLGKKKLPKGLPEHYVAGSPDEAVHYVTTHASLWAQQPKLLHWLMEQQ